MDSRDLTPDQLQRMTARLRPTLGYLHKLIERIEAESFPATDKLLRTAGEAEDRLQHLLTVLHYALPGLCGGDGAAPVMPCNSPEQPNGCDGKR